MEVSCCPDCGAVPDIAVDDAGLHAGAYVAFCERCERKALLKSKRPKGSSSMMTRNGRGMTAERAVEMWNLLVSKAGRA